MSKPIIPVRIDGSYNMKRRHNLGTSGSPKLLNDIFNNAYLIGLSILRIEGLLRKDAKLRTDFGYWITVDGKAVPSVGHEGQQELVNSLQEMSKNLNKIATQLFRFESNLSKEYDSRHGTNLAEAY